VKGDDSLYHQTWFNQSFLNLKDDLTSHDGKWGQEMEVMRMGLGIGPGTFYDMFTWVRMKGYQGDEHFQRFHIRRIAERAAIAKGQAPDKSKKIN
jgi:hypothetical protein